jgi:hypothetical protein
MSLQHDPSAVRYSTTQDAYGTTWTYLSTDESGSQTWKNTAGQTALVPKIEPFVPKGPSPDYSYGDGVDSLVKASDYAVSGEITAYFPMTQEMTEWFNHPIHEIRFDDTESLVVDKDAYKGMIPVWNLAPGQDVKSIKRNPIPDDRRRNVTITNVILEAATVADYSKLDVEIMDTLRKKGFFVNWGKIDE